MTIHLLNSRIYVNLKRKLCKRWTQWFIKEDKTYTCHSNMRSPGFWTYFDPNIINYLTIDSIQEKIDQHVLMKQVSLLNKQLALLRANQVSNTTGKCNKYFKYPVKLAAKNIDYNIS